MVYVFRRLDTKRKTWMLAYIGPDGRWHREATDAPDKKTAQPLLAKTMVQVIEARVAGVTIQRRAITFDAFSREYLKHVESVMTPSSAKSTRYNVQTLQAAFGDKELSP